MTRLLFGTEYISMDEPCFVLKEINGPAANSKGIVRWQVMGVVRNDRVASYRRSLGLTSKWQTGEFVIPGGVIEESGRIEIMHTVSELLGIADHLREGTYQRPDPPEPHDLIQGYYDQQEKKQLRRRKRSMSGPLVTIRRR